MVEKLALAPWQTVAASGPLAMVGRLTVEIVEVEPVAPPMSTPRLRHWNLRGSVPEALVLRVALCASHTTRSVGPLAWVGKWRTTAAGELLVVPSLTRKKKMSMPLI